MDKITTIGLDLAKHVFHVVCTDRHGKVIAVCREEAARTGVVPTLSRLESLTGFSDRDMIELFTESPLVLVANIAGLNQPRAGLTAETVREESSS